MLVQDFDLVLSLRLGGESYRQSRLMRARRGLRMRPTK